MPTDAYVCILWIPGTCTQKTVTCTVLSLFQSQLKIMGIVYVLPKITKQKHVKQLKDMNVVFYVKMNVKNM